MKVEIDTIRKTLEKIIVSQGVFNENDAEVLASDYVDGELNGKKSHGLVAFLSVFPKLSQKYPEMEIIKESDAAIYVEANNNFGAIVGRKVADILVKKAKKQGVAVAYVRNMKTWLGPGVIARYLAKYDMVGIVTNNGNPRVAVPGGVYTCYWNESD